MSEFHYVGIPMYRYSNVTELRHIAIPMSAEPKVPWLSSIVTKSKLTG